MLGLVSLDSAIADAVHRGLAAAVLVDHWGKVVSCAGDIEEDDLCILAHVLMSLSGDERTRRLFAGELLAFPLDERETFVGVAGRRLFVVAIADIGASPSDAKMQAQVLLDDVVRVLEIDRPTAPPPAGSDGSMSGPANLTLSRPGRGRA